MLSRLYADDHLVVVDKPAGTLVHPTPEARDRVTLMSLLRDELGRWVYPVHRLDRGTSGPVLFALSSEVAGCLNLAFRGRRVEKVYWAVVRGYVEEHGRVDYPVEGRPAITAYAPIRRTEIPEPVGPFPTARYTLVELRPHTGYHHQLRRHMKHLRHPILVDSTYGDRANDRFVRTRLGFTRLALAARSLTLEHPVTGEPLHVEAPVPGDFAGLLQVLGLA